MRQLSEKLYESTPIAHRGLHDEETPENSLAAYRKAIGKGYPIELDVRIIDDGNVIVLHDDTLGRMTGTDGYASNLRIADLEKIPTFIQALELVNGQVPLLIETKTTGKAGALESKLHDLLKNYSGEFALQSFDPYSMEYFRKHAPDYVRGLLSFPDVGQDFSFCKRRALQKLKVTRICDPHFLSYGHWALPNKYVARKNLPTLAWTVRSNSEYEKVQAYCDNIIFEGFSPEKA